MKNTQKIITMIAWTAYILLIAHSPQNTSANNPDVTHQKENTMNHKLIYEENFDKDLSNWHSEGPHSAEIHDGKLLIKTSAKKPEIGYYLWFKKDLPSDFRVEYDFTPVSKSGFFLVFFCAKGIQGEDILSDKLMKEYVEQKDFKKYTIGPINCYHISYRRNEVADCNLRKNTGKHLLRNSPVKSLIPANQLSHVVLTKKGGHITFSVNGEVFMDYTDDGKINNGIYGSGKFALRQIYDSEAQYSNFKVYDLTSSP